IEPFGQQEIDLVTTFADQAVIAIENTRLFEAEQASKRELQESLDYQTAISDVLNVISRSPTDVQPVFDMIAESAMELCHAEFCNVLRFDGQLLHFVASHGLRPEARRLTLSRFPLPPERGFAAGRAILSNAVEELTDVKADADYALRDIAKAGAYGSIVAVPMKKDGSPIGALAVGRSQVGPFPSGQIELLKTFADQAVIAIENMRLFEAEQASKRELQEALEQQTATADVLKVISRSALDLQKVLDALVESAARLCNAYDAAIFQVFGDRLRLVAHHGQIPLAGPVGQHTLPLVRGLIAGRAVIDRRTIHVADILAGADEYPESRRLALQIGYRTVLCVPLVHAGEAIGHILIRRAEVRPFTERQIELVSTFADQAVIAIENTRLFRETKEALERQTATAEILKVIASSPSDTRPVFNAIATSANRLLGGLSTAVWRFEGDKGYLAAFTPTNATADEALKALSPMALSAPLFLGPPSEGKIAQLADTEEGPPQITDLARLRGFRAVLVVPLISRAVPIGLVSVTRKEPGTFDADDIQLLQTFADQAAIAIENTRLFEAEQARTREVEVKSTELAQSLEYQTAISEVLGVISRSPNELQPVFNTIVASSKRLLRAHSAGVTRVVGNELRLAAFTAISPE